MLFVSQVFEVFYVVYLKQYNKIKRTITFFTFRHDVVLKAPKHSVIKKNETV